MYLDRNFRRAAVARRIVDRLAGHAVQNRLLGCRESLRTGIYLNRNFDLVLPLCLRHVAVQASGKTLFAALGKVPPVDRLPQFPHRERRRCFERQDPRQGVLPLCLVALHKELQLLQAAI